MQIEHTWVETIVNGKTIELDPSFKRYIKNDNIIFDDVKSYEILEEDLYDCAIDRSKSMQKQVTIALFIICCVKNAMNLNIALHFYHDIKAKAYTRCYAVITMAYGISNRNYDSRKYAKAKYAIEGKDITGKMICSYDSRVEKGDKVNIIVPENNLNIFAFSEKQVKNAVMTYSVLTSFFALCFITITIACAYLNMK